MVTEGGSGAGGDRRYRGRVNTVDVADSRGCNLYKVPKTFASQGWADLLDDLLHSIVAMLGSFRDLLAFAATCTSWRASFFSYPSKSTLFPPLLVVVPRRSYRFSNSLIPKRPCYVTNLHQDMHMRCQIPLLHYDEGFSFIGASYGHIFLARKQSCLVVDVFTGISVSPPPLPIDGDTRPYYAALTAPLGSPISHLIVITARHNIFFWHVGSHSWLRCSHIRMPQQVVVFKGQIFVMDYERRIFRVNFVPEVHLQEIAIVWVEEGMTSTYQWLVACDDMLLMISNQYSSSLGYAFKAFRLDLSTKPAKWIEVEKLENWAIFISTDVTVWPLCCITPERWGGRSNYVYYCADDSKGWITFELGKPLHKHASDRSISVLDSTMIESMWVVPSIFTSPTV